MFTIQKELNNNKTKHEKIILQGRLTYSDTKRWVSTQCCYSGSVYQITALMSLLLKVITGLFINRKLSFYFNSRNKN